MTKFNILVSKKFERKQVNILNEFYLGDSQPRELFEHINKEWKKAKLESVSKAYKLRSKQLYSLKRFRVSSRGTLELRVGRTSYKEYVGTRKPDVAEMYGFNQMADPLAVCSVIRTSDNKLLLGIRNSDGVESRAKKIHVVGGFVQPRLFSFSVLDPFTAIIREIVEETGIKERNIIQIHCLGLVYDCELSHPELIFEANVSLNSTVINGYVPNHNEMKLIFIENSPKELADFITLNHSKLVPTGEANLIEYGKVNFGYHWAKSVISEINYERCYVDSQEEMTYNQLRR